MNFSEKEFSIRARAEKGLPPPDWVEAEPELHPGDDFFLSAFYQLSSCRHLGEVPGAIPWNVIVQYADRRELAPDVARAFEHIIQQMDDAYLKWYRQKVDALKPKAPQIPKVPTHGRFRRKG